MGEEKVGKERKIDWEDGKEGKEGNDRTEERGV